MVRKTLIIILFAILFASCRSVDLSGFLTSPSETVDARFEQSLALTKGESVERLETDESYTFYVCTDTHVDGSTRNLGRFVEDMRSDIDAVFGVCLGDCIDSKGMMKTYADAISYKNGTHKSDSPMFSLIGNHDLFFSQWNDFKKYIGPSVYYFELASQGARDLYVVLDSANGSHGIRQISWLKELFKLHRGEYRHCVVMTHVNIFKTDNSQNTSGNLPLEETYMLTDLFDQYDVSLVLQGHDHYREDLIYRDVRYTIVGTIKDSAREPEYLKVRVEGSGLAFEWVYL